MTKRFLAFIAIALLSYGRSFGQSAAEMNTKLSAVVDSVVAIAGDWREKMGELKDGTKHFDELKGLRAHLDAVVDKETANLKKVKDVAESTRYRTGVLALLAYEKQMITGAFAPFEKLKPTATDDQVKALSDKLDDMSRKEDELKAEVTSAQNEFAKENKLTIEGGE
jgi:outer membrane murein-binding lipoprotein Lpp